MLKPIVVGWLSWKSRVFKLQFHTQISEVGSARKGGGPLKGHYSRLVPREL